MKPTKTEYPGVRRRGDVLYFRFADEHGKEVERRYGLGTAADAASALFIARARVAKIKAGLLDPRVEAMQRSERGPIAAVIEEYVEFLRAKGDSERHIRSVRVFCENWARDMRVDRLIDGTDKLVNRWLQSRPKWSASSHQQARGALLALYRWAEDTCRIGHNPIRSGMVPRKPAGDPVAPRRALAASEFLQLLDSMLVRSGPRKPGARPNVRVAQRRAFYMLLASTGLRWTEASRLRWGDITLSEAGVDDAGFVTVQAHQSKNRRRAQLPLVPATVAALRTIGPCGFGERVFPSGAPTLRTWLSDLEAAGVEAIDARGYAASRGCLRKSFCTWLRDNGVDLRDAQRLMRHSDPKLTASVYTDTSMERLREIVTRAVRIESRPAMRLTGGGGALPAASGLGSAHLRLVGRRDGAA